MVSSSSEELNLSYSWSYDFSSMKEQLYQPTKDNLLINAAVAHCTYCTYDEKLCVIDDATV